MATKLTELSAINIMLSNIGQAPVTSVDSTNPMVGLAKSILDEVSNAVQSEGWVFNTENHYPFSPSNGSITIPPNVLSFDISKYSQKKVVLRYGKLYDKEKHENVNEDVELDIVWLFSFTDLPEAFKHYIAIRAANLFAGRSIGSQEAVKYSEREEAYARASAIEYETQQGDYSMLSNHEGEQIQTYSPFNTIHR